MCLEVLFAEPSDLLEPGIVRTSDIGRRRLLELLLEQPPERRMSVDPAADVRGDHVVGESGLPLFADEPAVLQEAEMPRDSRLRDTQNAGQLGHVQPLGRQQPQQPEPRLVAEKAVESRRVTHIYKSTFIDVNLQEPAG